jgi:hypothetical protein
MLDHGDFGLSIKTSRRHIRDVRDIFSNLTPEQARILESERKRAELDKYMRSMRANSSANQFNQTVPVNSNNAAHSRIGGLQISASDSNLNEADSKRKSEVNFSQNGKNTANFRHRLRSFFFNSDTSGSGDDSDEPSPTNSSPDSKYARNLRLFLSNKPKAGKRLSESYVKYKKQIPVTKLVNFIKDKNKSTFKF